MSHLWALVITIECYANPSWPHVDGAHIDGRNTTNYLREDLNVPPDHILCLRDAEATRNHIIAGFQNHLIDNPKIRRGDAILVHYSGHGSALKAPAGWTVIEEKTGEETLDNLLEVIVPWDEGVIDTETGYPTCGIPDRTLAALINRIARAHGNNITIVLDCCCSGHGTRSGGQSQQSGDTEELRPRTVDPSLLSPLYTSLDEHLDVQAPMRTNKASRSRIRALDADHVLMAACGSREQAMGGSKFGGIFTRAWLSALRRRDVYPRTYAEILKVVDSHIEQLRRTHGLDQHPQCDGIVRDRLIFEETMMRADLFDAVPVAYPGVYANTIEIAAGEAHAVEVGTIFEIHSMNRYLESLRMLGTAIVRRVDATTSIAELPQGIPLTAPKYSALVTSRPERLRYIVVHDASPSNLTERSMSFFYASVRRMAPQDAQRLVEARAGEPGDVQFNFEGDGSITLYRLDPMLSPLLNRPPRLSYAEVENADFVKILNAIAKFNRLLTLTSASRPFADRVSFEIRHLSKRTDISNDEGFYIPEEIVPVEIVNDEATLVQSWEDEDEDYAIVLHNFLPKNLFVQVWYFDPNTYGIARCYTSPDFERPALVGNGGMLQIGASTELADPLHFYLPEGSKSDTIFAKVLLTDRPTRLDFMQQDDVIGTDQDGNSFILDNDSWKRAGGEEVEARGQWDVLLRKITVVEGSV